MNPQMLMAGDDEFQQEVLTVVIAGVSPKKFASSELCPWSSSRGLPSPGLLRCANPLLLEQPRRAGKCGKGRDETVARATTWKTGQPLGSRGYGSPSRSSCRGLSCLPYSPCLSCPVLVRPGPGSPGEWTLRGSSASSGSRMRWALVGGKTLEGCLLVPLFAGGSLPPFLSPRGGLCPHVQARAAGCAVAFGGHTAKSARCF